MYDLNTIFVSSIFLDKQAICRKIIFITPYVHLIPHMSLYVAFAHAGCRIFVLLLFAKQQHQIVSSINH